MICFIQFSTDRCSKLGLCDKRIKIALECDGTEIEDDDVFDELSKDDILFLVSGEEWCKKSEKEEVTTS